MTRGFTLIELLVTVGIIAILATTGIVSFGKVFAKARDARRISDIVTIAKGLDMYFVENDRYPAKNWQLDTSLGTSNGGLFPAGTNWNLSGIPPSSLKTLIDNGYLNSLPIDPLNNSNHFYLVGLTMVGEQCWDWSSGVSILVGNSSANSGCFVLCSFFLENNGLIWCTFRASLLQ